MRRPICPLLMTAIALLGGCRASEPSNEDEAAAALARAATVTPTLSAEDAAARDADVLRVVFDDMLDKANDEAPAEWNREPATPVYVSKFAPEGATSANEILGGRNSQKWKALRKTQATAATAALYDIIARQRRGDALPALRATSDRLKIYEDAGPATRPGPGDPFGERASGVYPPGYAEGGRFAVVHLYFPWSIHSGDATYVLEHADSGWKVLLRDFVYYL